MIAALLIPTALAFSSKKPKAKETNNITVAGQVVSFETKEPIENALVRIAIPDTDMRSVRVSTDHRIIELKTDRRGKFSKKISFTDEKYISVDVIKAGYGTVAGTFRGGGDPTLGQISLKDSFSYIRSNLKIKLQKALYIKGAVVDENNKPLSGIKVSGRIYTKRGHGGISQTQTNEQGTFELFDFPPTVNENETGRLIFTHPEYEKVTVSDIYEKNTSQLTSYRIVMPKGLIVKGKVLDSNGKPAKGLTVEAQTGKYGLFLRNTVTDAKGHFEITGLKKQNKIIIMSSTPDFGHKASQVLSPFNNSKDITLTLSPFKSDAPKTHSFLSMKVADVTLALRDKFDIPKKMNGVAILDPGSNSDRLGIGDLKTGYYFWMAGNKRIKNLKEMVTEILRIHAKPKPISGGMVTEGYEGMIRVVYGKRKGTTTTYLKLTEKDADQLRKLADNLGIDKVFLDGESLKEKVKNDLINQFNKSLDKTISASIKASPPMEDQHLTLQYAAGVISHYAGIPFNHTTTMKLAGNKWRKQIEPMEIKEKTAKEALAQLLNPEGLTYNIDEHGLHLIPIEKSDKKQEGDGGINPTLKNRLDSAIKLKRVGTALNVYAFDHDDDHPDTLEELRAYGIDKELDWALKNVEYLGKGKSPASYPETVIAYDRSLLNETNSKGTNVYYNRGYVAFEKTKKLKKLGIITEQKPAEIATDFEILKTELEPVAQGKNVLWITVENTTDKIKYFSVNVYSRSVDYGTQGIGWGTNFYEKFNPKETKKIRYAYKIQGPITENTYVRLNFYNAKSLNHDENKGLKHFTQKFYKSSDLKRRPDQKTASITDQDLSKTVNTNFTKLQSLIKNKKYDEAFNYFSKDYKKSEYQVEPLKRFKRSMEPKQRLDSAFTWDKKQFLKLKPKQAQINKTKNKITLSAVYEKQTWKITFIKETDQWKIDDITGYRPKILDLQEADKKTGKAEQIQKNATALRVEFYETVKTVAAENEEDLRTSLSVGFPLSALKNGTAIIHKVVIPIPKNNCTIIEAT